MRPIHFEDFFTNNALKTRDRNHKSMNYHCEPKGIPESRGITS
jgi:hypothetical protein